MRIRIGTTMDHKAVKKTVAALVGATVIVGVLNFDSLSTDMPEFAAQRGGPPVYIPPSLDAGIQRRLSLNLGGGACKWEPPVYDVPPDITFFKTIIAGFPSCDKRMTFTQMEALTGWPARDEWDFVFNGPTNHPFIKSNYPHKEGVWSWGDRADQVVLVVRNMRKTMVEYHDILWDIATAKVSNLSYDDTLYRFRPPIESFFTFRDDHVMKEIHWYGWFIDYWMEGGLQRDHVSNLLTTPDKWPYYPEVEQAPCVDDPWHAHPTEPNTCTNSGDVTPPTPPPTVSPTPSPTPNVTFANYTPPVLPPPVPVDEVPYTFPSLQECCHALFYGQECLQVNVCPTPSPTPVITASYDEHCTNGEVTNGCEPVAVISAEKLRDMTAGPAETEAIANALAGHTGISEYVIAQEAWQCIWTELIPGGRGMRQVRDRLTTPQGVVLTENDYNFSEEMLQEMVNEYDRLIAKYSVSPWTEKSTAVRLVTLLTESRQAVEAERQEVASGARRLTERDFLGPKERERRRRLKAIQEGHNPDEDAMSVQDAMSHFEYFTALEENVKTSQKMDEAKQRQEEIVAATKRDGHFNIYNYLSGSK